jgi:hypothetical protein
MGKRTGNPRGRPVGSPNKASVAREKAITASGLTPLEYMLTTLRDECQPVNVRLDAAKAAAQYVHPRLSAVEVKAEVSTKTNEDARTVLTGLLSAAPTGGTRSDPGVTQ